MPSPAIPARRAQTLLVAGGALLAFGVVAAVSARPLLLRAVSSAAGAEVTARSLLIAPRLAGPEVRLQGLAVRTGPGAPQLATVAKAEIALPWSALLGAHHVLDADLSGVRISLVRGADGQANWPTGAGGHGGGRPPRVDRLRLEDGALSVRDVQGGLSFQGSLATTSGPSPELVVQGQGRTPAGPWRGRLASPAQLGRDGERPLDVQVVTGEGEGASTARFQGRLANGRAGLSGRLQAAGPDLHDFATVLHVPLPHTPRYSLQAAVTGRDGGVRLEGIAGRVGASTLDGTLEVDPQRGGRRIEARLRSSTLALHDLLDVASSGKLTRGARPGRLIPDGPVNLQPLRKLYGRVQLDAAQVQSPAIRSLALTVDFDGGLIEVAPLKLVLKEGAASVRLTLDGRAATPRIGLVADVRDASTADFTAAGARPPLAVRFDLQGRLRGEGASFAAAAGAASGRLRITAGGGEIAKGPAALLTADLARGLLSALDPTRQTAAVRCGIADLTIRDGLGRTDALKLVTDAGAVGGSGELDLRSQTLDLLLRPLDAAAPHLTAVRLEGPLLHPRASLAVNGPTRLVGQALHTLTPSGVAGLARGVSTATRPLAESCGG